MTASSDVSRLHIAVGHATDESGATGLTVVRGVDGPMRAGVARFGRATGSRELLAASPDHLVDGRVDAIVLTGGSAFGLDAVAGVMEWMEQHGRGFPVGGGVVPIVPAAVLFDLAPLGRFDARPTPAMARQACEAASGVVEEGSVGAGTGATVGKLLGPGRCMKGGFGCATLATADGDVIVGALAVVNALGDVLDAHGEIIAGARDEAGGFADSSAVLQGAGRGVRAFADASLRNTTLIVVACSAALDAASLGHVANAAGAGLYRRIAPAGTSLDGDLIFAVSPAEGEPPSIDPMVIESLAAAAVEQAIERAVRTARGRDGIPGLADRHGH